MSNRISDAIKELADISIGSSESNHYADFVFSRDVFKVQSYNTNINSDNEDLDCTNEFNVSNISIEPTFCEDNSDDDETSIRSSLSQDLSMSENEIIAQNNTLFNQSLMASPRDVNVAVVSSCSKSVKFASDKSDSYLNDYTAFKSETPLKNEISDSINIYNRNRILLESISESQKSNISSQQLQALLKNGELRNVLLELLTISEKDSSPSLVDSKIKFRERKIQLDRLRYDKQLSKRKNMTKSYNKLSTPKDNQKLINSKSDPNLNVSQQSASSPSSLVSTMVTGVMSSTLPKDLRYAKTTKSSTMAAKEGENGLAEKLVKPPKLGTECIQLPNGHLEKLHVKNTGGENHFMYIGGRYEKLRMRIKATDNHEDWDISNKHNFSGLFYDRNEYMVSSASQSLENRHLLITEENALDKLFVNKIKLTKKSRPQLAQLETFSKKYFIGFICVVYDVHLRVLGTYDYKKEEFLPGVTICPSHLEKRKRRANDNQYANLLEIDFMKLPKNAFAVIPVLYDSSPQHAIFPEVHLQCNMSVITERNNNDTKIDLNTSVASKRGAHRVKASTSSSILSGPKSTTNKISLKRRDSYWEEPLQKIVENDFTTENSLDLNLQDEFDLNELSENEVENDNDSLFSIEKEEIKKKVDESSLWNTWVHINSFLACRNAHSIGVSMGFEGVKNATDDNDNDTKSKVIK